MTESNLIGRCRLIKVPVIPDHRGKIGVVEGGATIPFEIKRVYYLFDVPAGAERGGHAHKELEQLMVAVSGSFDVTIDDGRTRQTVSLRRPDEGLYIGPQVWREIIGFSSNAVCLVLASQHYAEADYIRSYEAFTTRGQI